jgi:hypothetical protein
MDTTEVKSLSQNERTMRGWRGASNYTYGEISFETFASVLQRVTQLLAKRPISHPSDGLRFWDLGSGIGKPAVAAALLGDFTICRGSEILGSLVSVAEAAAERYASTRGSFERLASVSPSYALACVNGLPDSNATCSALLEFSEVSFLDPRLLEQWRETDVFFANSTCKTTYTHAYTCSTKVLPCVFDAGFDSALMSNISSHVSEVKDGAILITFTRALKHPRLEIVWSGIMEQSWGDATVFIMIAHPAASTIEERREEGRGEERRGETGWEDAGEQVDEDIVDDTNIFAQSTATNRGANRMDLLPASASRLFTHTFSATTHTSPTSASGASSTHRGGMPGSGDRGRIHAATSPLHRELVFDPSQSHTSPSSLARRISLGVAAVHDLWGESSSHTDAPVSVFKPRTSVSPASSARRTTPVAASPVAADGSPRNEATATTASGQKASPRLVVRVQPRVEEEEGEEGDVCAGLRPTVRADMPEVSTPRKPGTIDSLSSPFGEGLRFAKAAHDAGQGIMSQAIITDHTQEIIDEALASPADSALYLARLAQDLRQQEAEEGEAEGGDGTIHWPKSSPQDDALLKSKRVHGSEPKPVLESEGGPEISMEQYYELMSSPQGNALMAAKSRRQRGDNPSTSSFDNFDLEALGATVPSRQAPERTHSVGTMDTERSDEGQFRPVSTLPGKSSRDESLDVTTGSLGQLTAIREASGAGSSEPGESDVPASSTIPSAQEGVEEGDAPASKLHTRVGLHQYAPPTPGSQPAGPRRLRQNSLMDRYLDSYSGDSEGAETPTERAGDKLRTPASMAMARIRSGTVDGATGGAITPVVVDHSDSPFGDALVRRKEHRFEHSVTPEFEEDDGTAAPEQNNGVSISAAPSVSAESYEEPIGAALVRWKEHRYEHAMTPQFAEDATPPRPDVEPLIAEAFEEPVGDALIRRKEHRFEASITPQFADDEVDILPHEAAVPSVQSLSRSGSFPSMHPSAETSPAGSVGSRHGSVLAEFPTEELPPLIAAIVSHSPGVPARRLSGTHHDLHLH